MSAQAHTRQPSRDDHHKHNDKDRVKPHGEAPRRPAPTQRMIAFAQRLAKDKNTRLPPGYEIDFEVCRRFLDTHANS